LDYIDARKVDFNCKEDGRTGSFSDLTVFRLKCRHVASSSYRKLPLTAAATRLFRGVTLARHAGTNHVAAVKSERPFIGLKSTLAVWTALHWVVVRGETPTVSDLMHAEGLDINLSSDGDDMT